MRENGKTISGMVKELSTLSKESVMLVHSRMERSMEEEKKFICVRTAKNGEYEGQFDNDKRHGCGIFTYPNGICSVREYYFGEFVSEFEIKSEEHKKQHSLNNEISEWQEQKSSEQKQLKEEQERFEGLKKTEREEIAKEMQKFKEEKDLEFQNLKKKLENDREELNKQHHQFEEDKKLMGDVLLKQSTIIKLNVGGMKYTTSKDTLCIYKDCILAKMFSGQWKQDRDEEGYYFIDRDGASFKHILRFLQNGSIMAPSSPEELYQLKQESEYFNLPGLTKLISQYSDH